MRESVAQREFELRTKSLTGRVLIRLSLCNLCGLCGSSDLFEKQPPRHSGHRGCTEKKPFSEFNPLLGSNSRREWVLDFGHLSD